MRLEGRALRAFFCSGSRVGCRGARDTRATTEMPEMATTDQAFRALRCKYIILAVPGELAPLHW